MEDATQTDNGTLASAALVTCPAWGPKPGKGLAQNSLRQNGTQLPKSGGNGDNAEKYTCTAHSGQSCHVHVMADIM